MKTLSLLAALLVLALPGRAELLEGPAEQVANALAPTALTAEKASDAEAQASVTDGQDQPEDEEQDLAVSFYGDERLTREASGKGVLRCSCRSGFCKSNEQQIGVCHQGPWTYRFCCYRA